MAFALVDDQVHGHPKFARAGLEAVGLWTLCLSYSAAYLTDGFVPTEIAQRYGGKLVTRLSKRLVGAELWEPCEGGWKMHDYHEHNPSAEEVKAKRDAVGQKRSVAGRKGAAVRWQNDGKPDGKTMANGMAESMAKPSQNDGPTPTPTPTEKDQERVCEPRAGARVDRAWLARRWGTWGTRVLMPDGSTLEEAAKLIDAYGERNGLSDAAGFEALAERAVRGFVEVLASWSFDKAATPALFVSKWDDIQGVLGGVVPRKRGERAPPAKADLKRGQLPIVNLPSMRTKEDIP